MHDQNILIKLTHFSVFTLHTMLVLQTLFIANIKMQRKNKYSLLNSANKRSIQGWLTTSKLEIRKPLVNKAIHRNKRQVKLQEGKISN